MRRQQSAAHFDLIEPWLAELDRLTRRRADNRSEIDAHLARFEGALLDWKVTTGQDIKAYRERLRQRIGEVIEAPWPKTTARVRKLTYALERLG
jgi:hypothetical protein